MEEIKRYNLARELIEKFFIGLPNASSKLIQLLITRADLPTGLVENLTYRDLAILLSVDHALGRKNAGTLTIETMRSYLRTIAKNCSDDFRLFTQGQKLKYHFPGTPATCAHFYAQEKVHAEDVGYIYAAIVCIGADAVLYSVLISAQGKSALLIHEPMNALSFEHTQNKELIG